MPSPVDIQTDQVIEEVSINEKTQALKTVKINSSTAWVYTFPFFIFVFILFLIIFRIIIIIKKNEKINYRLTK